MVDAVRKARQQLNRINKETSLSYETKTTKEAIVEETDWIPTKGESVYVPSIQAHAVVEKIGPGSQVTLRKGILTMQATLDQLRKGT